MSSECQKCEGVYLSPSGAVSSVETTSSAFAAKSSGFCHGCRCRVTGVCVSQCVRSCLVPCSHEEMLSGPTSSI